jgi:hypothetical protein
METHGKVQRRLCDSPFSLTTTPEECERVHQSVIEIYNTTAHQGRLQDQFAPPRPIRVLREAKGRLSTQEELGRQLARARCPRPPTAMAV